MTDIMYLIVASGGRYDDSWSKNEAVTADKAKAEAKVLELEAEHVKDTEAAEKLRELRDVIDGELGKVECEHLLPYPRWAPGLGKEQITQKMRNERTKIELKNKRIAKRNEAFFKARQKIITAREKALLLSLGYPKGHPFFEQRYLYIENVDYNIEEVDVLA